MRREAESHAADDIRRKELIEARNAADNAIYTSEKALRDLGDKVSAEIKSQVQAQVEKVRQVLKNDDVAQIKSATEELYRVVQQIGASMYQQPGGPQAGQPGLGQPSGPAGEDVVDGEFRSA